MALLKRGRWNITRPQLIPTRSIPLSRISSLIRLAIFQVAQPVELTRLGAQSRTLRPAHFRQLVTFSGSDHSGGY